MAYKTVFAQDRRSLRGDGLRVRLGLQRAGQRERKEEAEFHGYRLLYRNRCGVTPPYRNFDVLTEKVANGNSVVNSTIGQFQRDLCADRAEAQDTV